MTGAARIVAVIALMAGIARVLISCIIADPPPDPPTLPTEPPRICSGVVPDPMAGPLTQWPNQFVVPVLSSTTFVYGMYVDYDLDVRASRTPVPVSKGPGFANPDGGCQQVPLDDVPAPAGSGCHVVTFFAQSDPLGGGPTNFAEPGVVLQAPTQTAVYWFYDADGQGACSTIDASAYVDGAFPPTMDGFVPPIVDGKAQ